MAFINEFTPPEDVEKYGLKQIDKRFEFLGTTSTDQWTIDRERDIYLRHVARGVSGEIEVAYRHRWTFYWKGYELTLGLDLMEGGGERNGPGWSRWRLVWVNGADGLPEPLKPHQREILTDLKQALLTYKDDGVYSATTDYSVTLDIDSECEL